MRKIVLFLLLVSFSLSACLPTPTPTPESPTEEVTQEAGTEPAVFDTEAPEATEAPETEAPTPTTIGTVTADLGDITNLAEIIRLPEGTLEAKMLTNNPININLGNMPVYSFNFSVSGYTFTPTPYSGSNYQILPGKNPGQTLVAFTNGASGQTVNVNVSYKVTDLTGVSYDFTMPLSFNVTGAIPTQPPKGGGQGGSDDGGSSGGSGDGDNGGGGDDGECPPEGCNIEY